MEREQICQKLLPISHNDVSRPLIWFFVITTGSFFWSKSALTTFYSKKLTGILRKTIGSVFGGIERVRNRKKFQKISGFSFYKPLFPPYNRPDGIHKRLKSELSVCRGIVNRRSFSFVPCIGPDFPQLPKVAIFIRLSSLKLSVLRENILFCSHQTRNRSFWRYGIFEKWKCLDFDFAVGIQTARTFRKSPDFPEKLICVLFWYKSKFNPILTQNLIP